MNAEATGEKDAADEGRRFDHSQYDFLRQCIEKGEEGTKEWNEWRRGNPGQDIQLDGCHLRGCNLAGICFSNQDTADQGGGVYLRGANLRFAHLENSTLHHADLSGAKLNGAWLQHADLHDVHANRTIFYKAHLEGASLRSVVVDSETSFWRAVVDRETYFEGTALDGLRIDAQTRQLLEHNIRRKNWEEWYKEHPWLQPGVRFFWWISDYGLSTGRIVLTFFTLALVFAAFYYAAAVAAPPGVVNSLLEGKEGAVPGWLVPIRAVYFSVVTMTTLGFGDMHANCQSFWGHVLLTLQVLLGYVLLGALVTRFAVLFTAGGPAGRFAGSAPEAKEEAGAD